MLCCRTFEADGRKFRIRLHNGHGWFAAKIDDPNSEGGPYLHSDGEWSPTTGGRGGGGFYDSQEKAVAQLKETIPDVVIETTPETTN